MGSIPLPALAVRPPEQPDALGSVSKLLALKSMMNQQTQQQQSIKDLQARTKAMLDWDGKDPRTLEQSVLKHGGSADAATMVAQHYLQIKDTGSQIALRDSQTGETNLKNVIEQHNQALGAINAAEQVPDDQLPQHLANTINQLIPEGQGDPQAQQFRQQALQLIGSNLPPTQLRQHIDIVKKGLQGATEQLKNAQTEAQARKDNADAAMKEIEAAGLKGLTPELASKQVDNVFNPQDPQTAGQNRLLKSTVLGKLSQGDLPGAKQALQEGFQSALGVQKDVAEATNPAIQSAKLHLATATKAAEQAITDGDPKAAAQLLIDGTVAPSQIISSRKPAFAQQAFTAAQQMQPGWSAQKADADFKVASSPSNVAFFGSAKSLTDKGGTLDQLAAAAKDIPDNQIPVFNSVADAIRASTGSGPVAKYASLALGVADDYSKVMGGGQGSDTSRTQALSLIAAKQSPEQRAAAIEGIRGAVSSQTNSRIGNNAVLQKMYGVEPVKTPASGGAFSWDAMPEHKQ